MLMEKATAKKKEVAATTAVEPGSEKNRPIRTFQIDNVSCSVWARTIVKVDTRTYYSLSFRRSYVDAKGETKYSAYFNLSDLPKLITLCQDAEDYILNLQQKQIEGETD